VHGNPGILRTEPRVLRLQDTNTNQANQPHSGAVALWSGVSRCTALWGDSGWQGIVMSSLRGGPCRTKAQQKQGGKQGLLLRMLLLTTRIFRSIYHSNSLRRAGLETKGGILSDILPDDHWQSSLCSCSCFCSIVFCALCSLCLCVCGAS